MRTAPGRRSWSWWRRRCRWACWVCSFASNKAPRRRRIVRPRWHHENVPLYRDEAVVLRVHKLGEADRIVTLLTRRHGRVRAVGKGVRRTTSRFGARLEPGSHVDVQLYSRLAPDQRLPGHQGGLDVVQQAESLAAFGAQLATDYSRWTAVSAICETAERLTEEGEPALRLYLLVVGALRSLVERAHDPGLVLDAFFLRAAALAGWEPALTDCAVCSAPGPHGTFSVPTGGAVCPTCRPAGATRPQAETMTLMAALLGG